MRGLPGSRFAMWLPLLSSNRLLCIATAADLTGFIDGTANPEPLRSAGCGARSRPVSLAKVEVTFSRCAGYIDLDALHGLMTAEQEQVIGRTKRDSVELAADWMPSNAHIARTQVLVDDEELHIFRRSVPYGNMGEHGLYFVAFSAERAPLRPYAGTHVRHGWGRIIRPPDRFFAAGERGLLLCTIAYDPARAGTRRVTLASSPWSPLRTFPILINALIVLYSMSLFHK